MNTVEIDRLESYAERLALFSYDGCLKFHAFVLLAQMIFDYQRQICESLAVDSSIIEQAIRTGELKGRARAMRMVDEEEINEAIEDNEKLAEILQLYLDFPIDVEFDTEIDLNINE